MIVATVANTTIEIWLQAGSSRKNGLSTVAGLSRIRAPCPM